MNWFKNHQDEIQVISSLAVIASILLSLSGLYFSCQAKNETAKLKADAERVEVFFEAKFDEKEKIELISANNWNRFPVLKLYVNLIIVNLNPYRAIIIDKIEPSFVDGEMPSELSIKPIKDNGKKVEMFVVPAGSISKIRVFLSWPIDGFSPLCEFTKLLLEKRPNITAVDYKFEVGKHPEFFESSKKHGEIIFNLTTIPRRQDGEGFIARLDLLSSE